MSWRCSLYVLYYIVNKPLFCLVTFNISYSYPSIKILKITCIVDTNHHQKIIQVHKHSRKRRTQYGRERKGKMALCLQHFQIKKLAIHYEKKKYPPVTPFSRSPFLALIRTTNPALRLFEGSKQMEQMTLFLPPTPPFLHVFINQSMART